MKKSAKRIVSILSALIIFSTVVLADANVAGPIGEVRAESPAAGPAAEDDQDKKWGSNVGFDNLEKDTRMDGDRKIYNTQFGLHTDKTVFENAVDDGRTFDINLESWYIGENPVDVGLILDASGSMAWTTNPLNPLNVQDALTKGLSTVSDDAQTAIKNKYGLDNIDIASLLKYQEQHDGFLPEEIVELILNPKNTDDSKLGYNNYRYYIYEDRSDVSEFVPLGFWDGGPAINDDSLIGYYPFDGTLENKAPKAAPGSTAKYIPFTVDGNGFDENGKVTEKALPATQYYDPTRSGDDKNDKDTLDLAATAKKGALLLNDVSTSAPFTIAMRVKTNETVYTPSYYDELPLVYIGDLNGTNYIQLTRSAPYALKLKVHANGTEDEAEYPVSEDVSKDEAWKNWTNIILSLDESNKLLLYRDNTELTGGGITAADFSATDLKIIIGGDTDGYNKGYADFGLTDLCVFNSASETIVPGTGTDNTTLLETLNDSSMNTATNKTAPNIKHPNDVDAFNDILAAYYSFDKGELTDQASNGNGTALDFIGQATEGVFSPNALVETPAEPAYEKYQGRKGLNINTLQEKGGAVLLDSVPNDLSNFTVSFRLLRTAGLTSTGERQNLFYIGNKKATDYFQFFRSAKNGGYLALSNKEPTDASPLDTSYTYYQGGLQNTDTWYTNTLVFEPVGDNQVQITPYIDGTTNYNNNIINKPLMEPIVVQESEVALIIGALKSSATGSEHYIDDVFVFDKALTETEVSNYFGVQTECETSDKNNKRYHMQYMKPDPEDPENPDKYSLYDLAQITSGLYNSSYNTRRGWYYVNSGSYWEDVIGCLYSTKNYVGISNADTGPFARDQSIATVPSSYTTEQKEQITQGDDPNWRYIAPDEERSLQFYIDNNNCLRCFTYCGGQSQSSGENNRRTVCSLVYENLLEKKNEEDKTGYSETKYETLNGALNTFFGQLSQISSLTNVSAVKFSMEKLVDKDRGADELKKLLLLKWITMSALSESSSQSDSGNYDIVLPRHKNTNGELDSGGISELEEYNYVLTGGTFTWTGLKAFYDQLANDTNITKDNNPKYLIVFTDGRDNVADPNNTAKEYISYAPEGVKVEKDHDLAKAWADKIKNELGYTIYCVMMATGSVNKNNTVTQKTYEEAATFLASLAGNTEYNVSYNPEDESAEHFNEFVFISDPTDENNTLEQQFNNILGKINVTLTNYTVQDYIDPRFDLVTYETGEGDSQQEVLYKLGAGGNITRFDLDDQGKPVGSGTKLQTTLGNIINDVNAYGEDYTTKDGKTAKIYYDDEKDMYYLRWTNQKIGGGFKPFNSETDKIYLNDEAWSSTITVRAKDDFIGGNDILTNGNEAGMNLVYAEKALREGGQEDGNLLTGNAARDKLTQLSGTDNSVDRIVINEDDGTTEKNPDVTDTSKGFPRTTANVRLLPVNTRNINDVIYLGEVVSPTMMLSEVEDQYMSDSYYLEYLKRYAYRIYGDSTDEGMPLIDLLNAWLKIDDTNKKQKTFTIPYIYLPDPKYEGNKFVTEDTGDGTKKVVINNNAGTAELNQRDIVGFITYTWEQVSRTVADQEDDITKEFVVKDTQQIQYNLQMKFTPLKTGDLEGFTLDSNFVDIDKFFKAENGVFVTGNEYTTWSLDNRKNLLDALVNDTTAETTTTTTTETTTESSTESSESTTTSSTAATQSADAADDSGSEPPETYGPELFAPVIVGPMMREVVTDTEVVEGPVLREVSSNTDVVEGPMLREAATDTEVIEGPTEFKGYISSETVREIEAEPDAAAGTGTIAGRSYLWDSGYKPSVGDKQIFIRENGTHDYGNAKVVDSNGQPLLDDPPPDNPPPVNPDDAVSLAANTIYIKDVVNGALAVKMFIKGSDLKDGSNISNGETITVPAIRNYTDELDPLPYDKEGSDGSAEMGANAKDLGYNLKFTIENIPDVTEDETYYPVWAKLEEVSLADAGLPEGSVYEFPTNTLPIGTYTISNDFLSSISIKPGVDGTSEEVKFTKLNADGNTDDYAYDRFPEEVVKENENAAKTDPEYQIRNGTTDYIDYSRNNIADRSENIVDTNKKNITFYLGTTNLSENDKTNKGESKRENPGTTKEYVKDRLGIILLSYDDGSLTIEKQVTNAADTSSPDPYTNKWIFDIRLSFPVEDIPETDTKNYTLSWTNDKGEPIEPNADEGYAPEITFTKEAGTENRYTGQISLKSGEKVKINGLPVNVDYTVWESYLNQNPGFADKSLYNIYVDEITDETNFSKSDVIAPGSSVLFINQFWMNPLPETGGPGVYAVMLCGIMLIAVSFILLLIHNIKRRCRNE